MLYTDNPSLISERFICSPKRHFIVNLRYLYKLNPVEIFIFEVARGRVPTSRAPQIRFTME